MITHTRTVVRMTGIRMMTMTSILEGLNKCCWIFLSIHNTQQPHRGQPSNVFRRFGRRWSFIFYQEISPTTKSSTTQISESHKDTCQCLSSSSSSSIRDL